MYYKKTLLLSLYLVSLLFAILLMTIYIVDPFMFFHKHWIYKNQVSANFRIQNYGLLSFEKFNGIIIGTSMLENTSANEASEKLGNNFANLSFSAARYYERYLMLQHAFKKHNINHVITSLDYQFNDTKVTENTFLNLYENDYFYKKFHNYFNSKAMLCIFNKKFCDFKDKNLDRPRAWLNSQNHARRFGGFDNWLKHKSDGQIKDALNSLKNISPLDINKYKEIIDQEIEPLFQRSDVRFDLVIPPYSLLWWARYAETLDTYLQPYSYLIKKAEKYPNVHIYWFYDEDFVADISFYKDLTHYHYSVNSLQLDAIKNGTNLINIDNYQQKFAEFKRRIDNFDLEYYLKRIE